MAHSPDHPREVDAAVGRLAGDDGPDTAGILVWAYVAGRQLDVWLSEALADSGLSTSDYGALAGVALADDRPMTAGDLARWVVQTSGGTAKTLQRLVDRGLVRRVADNMRSLALPRLPDGFKLKLEMSLYDSPLHLLRRNGERLAGLLIRRTHELPGLPTEEADAQP